MSNNSTSNNHHHNNNYNDNNNENNSPFDRLVTIEEVDFSVIDICLCCLPHGTTQVIISQLLQQYPHLKIVDLSADFRLKSYEEYAEWYGNEHQAKTLQDEAIYGIPELLTSINKLHLNDNDNNKDKDKDYKSILSQARLIANPGCYPTCIQLALVPLILADLINININNNNNNGNSSGFIIIDAKSGVSGAGRSVKQSLLFSEVSDGMHSYGLTSHRYTFQN